VIITEHLLLAAHCS